MVVDASIPEIPTAPRFPTILPPQHNELTPIDPLPLGRPALLPPGYGTYPGTPARSWWRVSNIERVLWLAAGVLLVAIPMGVGGLKQRARPVAQTVTEEAEDQRGNAANPPASPAQGSDDGDTSSSAPASDSVAATPPPDPPDPASASAVSTSRASASLSLALAQAAANESRGSSAATPPLPAGRGGPAPDRATIAAIAGTGAAEQAAEADGSRFDGAAARRAVLGASQRIGYCAEGKVTGAVVMTFAPTGLVQNASLVALRGDNVRSDCILRSFQSIQIPPFKGDPVTIKKSFRVP